MKKITIKNNLIVMIIADAVLLAIAYTLAFALRFDLNVEPVHLIALKKTILPIIILKLFIFYFSNLYQGMWRYTSIVDLMNVIKAVFLAFWIVTAFILMFTHFKGYARSVYIIDAVISLLFIAGLRLTIRILLSNPSTSNFSLNTKLSLENNKKKRLIIIGAGDAGEKVLREIIGNAMMHYKVVGFVDDDKRKIGKYIHGIKIFGKVDQLYTIVQNEKIDEILIAAPSTVGKKMRRIVEICDSTKIPYKTLPGMGELIDGKVSIKTVRDISYKDLLRRPTVRLENDKILNSLNNSCVLITGAGGSIGSELCRQICKYSPSLVILFDASESNLYSIQMELKHEITYLKYRAVLGHVQDERLLDEVFKKYKPKIVFHAAAYKHVPLVERNPWEAVFSNVVGTNVLVKISIKHNVERFVLVSSDKAVRPTNVMGTTKRVAEKIIQSQIDGETKFMAVRFGNVVGSSGSVIPLFRRQIERGGPVTVTHPEITRYFMTIEEACQLILQAFTMGSGGEIFILEMGIPVKIVDMARDLIRLSGKDPDIEIKIEYTGLRPGEKLYEELITVGEGIVKTGHEKILVLRNGIHNDEYDACTVDPSANQCLNQKINELVVFAKQYDSIAIKQKLKEIVPEYTISDDEAVV